MFFARQKRENPPAESKNPWGELLELLHQLNRGVKEPGWYDQDKRDIYALKDMVMTRILEENPIQLQVQMYRIPYIVYSEETKNRAGAMMRSEGNRYPFDVYLALVKPSALDVEDVKRATVEVQITCQEKTYSFHCPAGVVERAGIEVGSLPNKEWVAPADFHHEQYVQARERIETLLAAIE